MSSSHKHKKKPAYDITVRPINTSMISSIEELVGRFIDNSNNKTNNSPLNDDPTNKPDLLDQNLNTAVELSPSIQTPPITQTQEPLSNRHVKAPSTQTPPITLTEVKGNLSLPNTILDSLLPQLEPFEQLIYLRLFRLSHGFRKDTCIVGMEKLAKTCHISLSSTIRAIRELEKKGLIHKLETKLGGKMTEIRGNIFWVLNPSVTETSPILQTPSIIKTPPVNTTSNKDHHDDSKKQDHHKSTTPTQNTIGEHENAVMTIYQKITENNWTKADRANYEKVKHVGVDKIEVAIKAAMERAHNCPNSFAYFIKEILRVNNPPKQNLLHHKKSMQKIVDRVRSSFIGSTYSISDFVYKVKDLCLREDLPFDNDLLDQILDRENRGK